MLSDVDVSSKHNSIILKLHIRLDVNDLTFYYSSLQDIISSVATLYIFSVVM